MKLLKYNELPDIASRLVWQDLLGVSRQALVNAERDGRITGRRMNSRMVVYTKRQVIDYLGLSEHDVQGFTNDKELEGCTPVA
jgi:hypothetical protein